MKQIRNESLTVAQANERLGVDMEPGFWETLVRMIGYPELTFDPGTLTIRFPGYVPFGDLAKEWIEGIEEGIYDLRQCERCAEYFDINASEGIFGNLADREEYVCDACSRAMTAREYFDRFVARGDIY
jgi:hypothetical protein